ncbi:uncharacterized protein MICPUCDRAFT_53583 [Micromonas pusilla CCMP1545]|uniref:Predicted protein n=1 Tax=Micromonas pusilla (strain CCMP1545) TaxID=564608 RepID=C1N776_MICPC|nr:uncharacterized protein MICPUCDRAFT_53583 [Micromonas pusilla CCMP1545]EEH52061.1 predicted protein [Micromonas pusilla CCMP1545]|eukprot:XP_003063688.1 predicted protein [Micromonas pusilla CCMP1545]
MLATLPRVSARPRVGSNPSATSRARVTAARASSSSSSRRRVGDVDVVDGRRLVDSDAASSPPSRVVSSVLGAVASASLALALSACPGPALAEAGQKPPPVRDMPGGCTIEALDLFKDTRAKFSLEVGTGALPEAILDLGGCDYSGADLDGKVLSGAIMSGANFEGAIFTGGEASRAKAVGTNFRGSVLRGTNFYEMSFAGADLRGADFDNAILTNARFGRDGGGNWAQLDGVNWEGALLSSSDAQRACENPTVDDYGRAILGCR